MTFNQASTDLTGKSYIVTGDAVGAGASTVVFLASEQSAFMTAQTVGVDGGNVLR